MTTFVDNPRLRDFASALGEELRQARQQRGWSRKQLLAHLSTDISIQTVATYESGTRQCSVVRLVELCEAMGIHAHDLLARVLERTEFESSGHLVVDLDRVADDQQSDLTPLHRWAGQRLAHAGRNQPHSVALDLTALEYMAELCGITTVDLINRLRRLARDEPATQEQHAR